MKVFNKLVTLAMLSLILSGCAAGAATAGYALKAQSSDGLTADAEQRIVDRAKREIKAEMSGSNACVNGYQSITQNSSNPLNEA